MLPARSMLAIGQMHSQGMGHAITGPLPPGAKSPKCTNRLIPQFEDVTAKAGITFTHTSSKDKKYIFESMTGGVIIFDYDRDGWPGSRLRLLPALSFSRRRVSSSSPSLLPHTKPSRATKLRGESNAAAKAQEGRRCFAVALQMRPKDLASAVHFRTAGGTNGHLVLVRACSQELKVSFYTGTRPRAIGSLRAP